MVKGRMYDVATQHLTAPVDDYVEAAAKQVMTIHMSPNSVVDGDVLVFMPGAEEIEMCADILRRAMKELEHLKGGANGRTGHKAQEVCLPACPLEGVAPYIRPRRERVDQR